MGEEPMKRHLVLFSVFGFVAACAVSAQAQFLIGGPATASDPPGATSHKNGNLDLAQSVEVVPGFFLPQPTVWINNAFKTLPDRTKTIWIRSHGLVPRRRQSPPTIT
jgi:hypothetical protein